MTAIFIIFLCLFLNALFSCAEMAFVTVNKNKIHREEEKGSKRAQIVEKMHKAPERILSVIQIGITLVAAVSAAVSGAFSHEYLTPVFMDWFDLKEDAAESLSILVVVIPLTFLTVLIGELVPKSIAIKYSMKISLFLAPALKVAEKILGFLVTPLENMTNFLVKILFHPSRIGASSEFEDSISIHDLKQEHQEYVHNIIDLDVKTVSKALVNWDKVKWIDSTSTGQEVKQQFLLSNLTRMPVMDQGEVYGFIHLKEFLQVLNAGEKENWLSYIRPPVFISPDLKLINALRIMKKNKVQILIVGKAEEPVGIVTLEDVIEEVVGDIVDETEDKKIVGFLRQMVIRK